MAPRRRLRSPRLARRLGLITGVLGAALLVPAQHPAGAGPAELTGSNRSSHALVVTAGNRGRAVNPATALGMTVDSFQAIQGMTYDPRRSNTDPSGNSTHPHPPAPGPNPYIYSPSDAFSPHNVEAAISSGVRSLSYRVVTELRLQNWHWIRPARTRRDRRATGPAAPTQADRRSARATGTRSPGEAPPFPAARTSTPRGSTMGIRRRSGRASPTSTSGSPASPMPSIPSGWSSTSRRSPHPTR